MSHVQINTTQNPAFGDVQGGGGSSTTVKLNNILPGDAGVDVTLVSGGFFVLESAVGKQAQLTVLGRTGVYIEPTNGYVGINTSVPIQALTVSGAAQISTNILFYNTNTQHTIHPLATTGAQNGDDLLVEAGEATVAQFPGGMIFVRSGKGGDGTGIAPAGNGGDLRIHGGDAGSDGGGGGSTGGNIHIYGGTGTNAIQQHGGIIIGEVTTDEVRIGHVPVAGINLGHIRHAGHFAIGQGVLYTVRYELQQIDHIIDGAPQVAGGGNGVGLFYTTGAGGAASGGAAGAGGLLTITAGTGGAGDATHPGATGGNVVITAGTAGAAAAGGGGAGGSLSIDAGAATGAASPGILFLGTISTNTSATNIGTTARTTTIAGGSTLFTAPTVGTVLTITNSGATALLTVPTTTFWDSSLLTFTFGNRTITVQTPSVAASNGGALFIVGGSAGGTAGFSGGDVHIEGGLRNGTTFGGSVHLDASAGSNFGNGGVILLGVTGGTNTFRCQILSDATQHLGFYGAGVAQQTPPGITTAGFTANASANAVFAESTFTGNTGASAYTVSDVVRCLKNYGLLAA